MNASASARAIGEARLSEPIARLFPSGVIAAELHGNANVAALEPGEGRACAGFSAKRARDFAAGRLCARRALREFGYSGFELHVAADRRPTWPGNLVGSISHTAGYCGAVVASAGRFASIGFDAEIVGGVSEDLWPGLFTPGEIAALRAREGRDRATAATIAFSAKEAYYKCHFGITPVWLDFTDVAVALDASLRGRGTFDVRPSSESGRGAARPRSGCYAVDGTLVSTGVAAIRA